MPDETEYLPKQPLDLPKPHDALPKEPTEIPAHASHQVHSVAPQAERNTDKTLLTWHAPGRPFRSRDKSYYVNILILMFVIEVILFLFSQYLLMLVVISLVFVNYALTKVPPYDFRYKVSTQGFMVEDHFYLWQELYDFYFKKQEKLDVLVIRTKAFMPGELIVTLGEMHKEHVKTVMLPYLPYREFVQPSSMEKAGDWLSRTFPLERTKPQSS